MKSRLNLNIFRKVGQLALFVPIVWGASSGIAQAVTIAPIANSSFETGDFTGWTVGGNNNVFTVQNAAGASDGDWFASFNRFQTTPGATLSQTFSTIAGAPYTLTFDFRKAATGSGTAALDVLVQDSSSNSLLNTTVSDDTGGSAFDPYSFSFTANSTSTTLTFVDTSSGTTNFDAVLDNVQASTPVPEPTTILGSLLAGSIGIVARRKRR